MGDNNALISLKVIELAAFVALIFDTSTLSAVSSSSLFSFFMRFFSASSSSSCSSWPFVVATILLYLTLILVFTMPESPKFLLAKGKFAEARAVMTRIAQYNRLNELHFTEEEKEETNQQVNSQ